MTDTNSIDILIQACGAGQSDLVKSLLEEIDAPVLNQLYFGSSILYIAIISESFNIVKQLLKVGADPNIINDDGEQPLCAAARRGLVSIVELLLEHGADPYSNHNDSNAYEIALNCGSSVCAALIERYQRKHRAEAVRTLQSAALLLGVDNDEAGRIIRSVKTIFLNEILQMDESILNIAVRKEVIEIVKLLLDLGMDVLKQKSSPFAAAVSTGQDDIVKLILNHVPWVAVIPLRDNFLPIHLATSNKQESVLECLLETDYRSLMIKDISSSSEVFEQHKHLVTSHFLEDIIQGEVEEKASSTCSKFCYPFDLCALTTGQQTALHLAAAFNSLPCAKLILKKLKILQKYGTLSSPIKKIVNRLSPQHRTSFHEALIHNNVDLARLLCQFGADVCISFFEFQSNEDCLDVHHIKYTPLMYSVENSMEDMTDLLLEYNAKDPEFKVLFSAWNARAISTCGLLLSRNAASWNTNACPFHKESHGVSDHSAIYKKLIDNNYSATLLQSNNTVFVNMNKSEEQDTIELKPLLIHWMNVEKIQTIDLSWLNQAAFQFYKSQEESLIKNALHAHLMDCITKIKIENCESICYVPSKIFFLSSLVVIDLRNNVIDEIEDFSLVTNEDIEKSLLEELRMRGNRLREVPRWWFQLPNLREIDLSHNDLRIVPQDMWCSNTLSHIDLSENPNLHALPEGLIEECLDMPFMTNPQQGSDYQGPSEHEASLSDDSSVNSIEWSDSSEGMEQRDRQCNSAFANNELGLPKYSKSIPTSANAFKSVQRGYWKNNYKPVLDYLEPDQGQKQGSCLKTLKLNNCGLASLPKSLSCLAPNLVNLFAKNNKIDRLGFPEQFPFCIELIELQSNKIKLINDTKLLALECLRKVSVRGSMSTGSFKENRKLSTTRCSHKRHQQLPFLKQLNLSENLLTEIVILGNIEPLAEDNIQRALFPKLGSLYLNDNNLFEIPSSIGLLDELSVLDISNNSGIRTLPLQIGLLHKLFSFRASGCNLTNDLKARLSSREHRATCKEFTKYMEGLLKNSKPYRRIKLMFVGHSNVGKTVLLNALRKQRHASSSGDVKQTLNWAFRQGYIEQDNAMADQTSETPVSTVGVDIADWIYPVGSNQRRVPITFYTWDFAGQEEYYVTHQYFLTTRSIYLLIFNMCQPKSYIQELNLWLNNIQSCTENAFVIIVGTHYDEYKKNEKKYGKHYPSSIKEEIERRYKKISERSKKGIPEIVDVIFVSSVRKGRYNIETLCDKIYEIAANMADYNTKEKLMEQTVPDYYIFVEDAVKAIRISMRSQNVEPILSFEQFREKINEYLRREKNMALDLHELKSVTSFLHENGIVLHYSSTLLNDRYFIDPQWLCDQLAEIISVKYVRPEIFTHPKGKGVISVSRLKSIINKKSPNKEKSALAEILVVLLAQFEVALTYDGEHMIIPSHFPTERDLKSYKNTDRDILITSVDKPVFTGFQVVENRRYIHTIDRAIDIVSGEFVRRRKQRPRTYTFRPIIGSNAVNFRVHAKQDTSLALSKYYLVAYVPTGLWPRLIARLMSDNIFCEISNSIFLQSDASQKLTKHLKIFKETTAKWTCWKTGLRLNHLGTEIFHLKEVLPSSESEQTTFLDFVERRIGKLFLNKPENYSNYLLNPELNVMPHDPVFQLKEYCIDNLQKIIEIYIPHTELTITDEQEKVSLHMNTSSGTAAKIMEVLTERIDSLLDEWYPSLGDRFLETMEGEALVERLIPCNECISTVHRHIYQGSENLIVVMEIEDTEPESDEVFNTVEPEIPVPTSSECASNIARVGSVTDSLSRFHSLSHRSFHDESFPYSPVSKYESAVSLQNYKSKITLPEDIYTKLDSDSCSLHSASISSGGDSSDEFLDTIRLTRKTESFDFEDVIVATHSLNVFFYEEVLLLSCLGIAPVCSVHGIQPVFKMAPELLFHDLPKEMLFARKNINVNKYLGSGGFGSVFRAKINSPSDDNEKLTVAVKYYQPVICGNNVGIPERERAYLENKRLFWAKSLVKEVSKAFFELRQELGVIMQLNHQFIMEAFGASINPLSMIMDLAPLGSLQKVIENYESYNNKPINTLVIRKTLLQIMFALSYMHHKRFVYRDLKSANVLVWSFPSPEEICNNSNNVLVRLSDYGICRRKIASGARGKQGTPAFMSPEIFAYDGNEVYTDKVDVYSFSMVMYEMLFLRSPWHKQNLPEIRTSVIAGKRPAIYDKDKLTHVSYLDLMTLCSQQNPSDRPTGQETIEILRKKQFSRLSNVLETSLSSDNFGICNLGFTMLQGEKPEVCFSVGLYYIMPSRESSLSPRKYKLKFEILHLHQNEVDVSHASMNLGEAKVTAHGSVNDSIFLGTGNGQVKVIGSKDSYLEELAVLPVSFGKNAISHIFHLKKPGLSCVVIAADNGTLYAYDDDINVSQNFIKVNQFATSRNPIGKIRDMDMTIIDDDTHELWIGMSTNEILRAKISKTSNKIHFIPGKLKHICENEVEVRIVQASKDGKYVWSTCRPDNKLHRWCTESLTCESREYQHHIVGNSEDFSLAEIQICSMVTYHDYLYAGTKSGHILVYDCNEFTIHASFQAHSEAVRKLIPLEPTLLPHSDPLFIRRLSEFAMKRKLLASFGKGFVHPIELIKNSLNAVTASSSSMDRPRNKLFIAMWTSDDWQHD